MISLISIENHIKLGISTSITWLILRVDLVLSAHKVQLVQELESVDHFLRRHFANFMFKQGDGFSEKIIFSDKTHFYLNGCLILSKIAVFRLQKTQE